MTTVIPSKEREAAFRKDLDKLLAKHRAEMEWGVEGVRTPHAILTVQMDSEFVDGVITKEYTYFEL